MHPKIVEKKTFFVKVSAKTGFSVTGDGALNFVDMFVTTDSFFY